MTRQDIHPEKPLDRETRVRALVAAAIVLLLGVTLVSIAAVGYLALKGAEQSADNGAVLKEVKAANARIIDCTTPGGQCLKEQDARMGAVVTGINDGTLTVIVAAITCQDEGITEQRALARCTVKRAKAAQ